MQPETRQNKRKAKKHQQDMEKASDLSPDTDVGPHSVGADIEGIPLDAYAAAHDLPQSAVWAKIKAGVLVARSQHGKVYVYGESVPDFAPTGTDRAPPPSQTPSLAAAGLTNIVTAESNHQSAALPPPPLGASPAAVSSQGTGTQFLSLSGRFADSPEVALLLDHLSLAKEENREVLRLAQESIQSMTAMTERVMLAKDQLLGEKDRLLNHKDQLIEERRLQMETLRERVQYQEQQLRKARQDLEDMETLTRTLANS